MSGTAELSSRRISASTAARSSPTRAATRSLRTRSRVGVATRTALLRNDAVAHLHLGARRGGLDLGQRELFARLRHARRRDLVVQLPQDFAGDRMHHRDAVTGEI